ncbi:DUF2793 domain-containing protein [Roseibium sp.]|uniref:DUF2793 domain-containing protein n=1 Tax=Roseibium sp. TaxID=1936156 RepID=UPI003A96EA20
MSDTLRFALPLLAAAQAQKHVTHNEALLTLDALAHLHLKSRSLAAAPIPVEGDAFLVASGASGDWSGREGQIALWRDGIWHFHAAFAGLVAFVADEEALIVATDSGWREVAPLMAPDRLMARSEHGAGNRLAVLEEELTALAGTYAETSALIPDRAIVFGVSCRTTTEVTGASSYDCGLAGEPSKFGGSLGVSAGATNAGIIGPTAFYADTPVRVSANGGSFTGGSVRLAVHCLIPVVPAS